MGETWETIKKSLGSSNTRIRNSNDAIVVALAATLELAGMTPAGESGKLPNTWNTSSPNYYQLQYTMAGAPSRITVTVSSIEDNLLAVHVVFGETKADMEIAVSDYAKTEVDVSHTASDSPVGYYRSEQALESLRQDITSRLLTPRLLPLSDYRTRSQEQPSSQTAGFDSYVRPPPELGSGIPTTGTASRGPPLEGPPGFEDEYEMQRPMRHIPQGGGGPFLPIGDDDLNPPGLGRNPLGTGLPGVGGGPHHGMHPSLSDPRFTGGRRGDPDGGDDFRPPGSRYDPTGPPGFGGGFSGGGGGFI